MHERDHRLRLPFLCECGSSLCPERVWLSLSEYDGLTALRPALAPEHEHRPPDTLGECRWCRERRLRHVDCWER